MKEIETAEAMAGSVYPMAAIGVEPDRSLHAAYVAAIRERDRVIADAVAQQANLHDGPGGNPWVRAALRDVAAALRGES